MNGAALRSAAAGGMSATKRTQRLRRTGLPEWTVGADAAQR
jgi:hypothetical protein